MSADILSLTSGRRARAKAQAERLGDIAVRLRLELARTCAEHAVKCLEADGIDLSDVDDTEIAAFKATNAIVWLEQEALRIREEKRVLEAELDERGVPRNLNLKLRQAGT